MANTTSTRTFLSPQGLAPTLYSTGPDRGVLCFGEGTFPTFSSCLVLGGAEYSGLCRSESNYEGTDAPPQWPAADRLALRACHPQQQPQALLDAQKNVLVNISVHFVWSEITGIRKHLPREKYFSGVSQIKRDVFAVIVGNFDSVCKDSFLILRFTNKFSVAKICKKD